MIIDGRSRYLLPGMVDTHTHLATNVRELLGGNPSAQTIEESARNQLMLYLARGVTTILNNGDFGEPLPRWATEVEAGVLTGPHIYAAQYARGDNTTPDGGPPNRAITDASQARGFTRQSYDSGYDFMKIYNYTPRDGVLAILDEAHSLGMPVLGHFPQTMSTRETLENGMDMVAHSGAYLWRFFGGNTSASDSQIAQAVQLTVENGTSVTATVGIEEIIDRIWCNDTAGVSNYWARAETRYMHPTTVGLNDRSINAKWRWNPDGCFNGGYTPTRDFLRRFTLALHQGGAPIMMGTDSPTVLGVPGFSAADEVQALVNSGIEPLDAIRIASFNGADFISRTLALEVPFGSITEGSRADLLLLGSNPIESVDNIKDILGVMLDGRWNSSAWFDDQLEDIARSYGN